MIKIELKKALIKLSKTVEKKDSSQMSSRLFINIEDRVATLKTTDFDCMTEIKLNTNNKNIEANINFNDFKSFVTTSNGEISLSIKDDNLVIEDDNQVASYPMFPNAHTLFDVFKEYKNIGIYKNNIDITTSLYGAIATNYPKFELNGLQVDFKEGRIVSTDTKRLQINSIEKDENLEQVIIPKIALSAGTISDIRLFKNNEDKNIVSFTQNNCKIVSKLITGSYPTYQRIIPQFTKSEIKINGLDLKKKLKGYKEISMIFKNNICKIESLSDDNNVKSFKVVCDYASNIPFDMSLDSKHLVNGILNNEIILKINDNSRPFLISDNTDNIAVIMPIILYDYSDTISPQIEKNHNFKYDIVKKKTVKKVNKDLIIQQQLKEINRLRKQLKELKNGE